MRRAVFAILVWSVAVAGQAQDNAYLAPPALLANYKNRVHPTTRQGSCVQASISMCGLHHGVDGAECLLRNDPTHGPAELGGSFPSRTAAYMAKRQIPIFNVEGSQTMPWIEWALRNGRYAAVTYGQAHMIIASGISADGSRVQIVDNNYPTEPRWVTRDVFLREHRGYAGGWTTILDTHAPSPWMLPASLGPTPTPSNEPLIPEPWRTYLTIAAIAYIAGRLTQKPTGAKT